MAEVINKNQQVIVAGTRPRAAYSRVVSLHQVLPADGIWYVAITPNIGNNVWLLGVDVWLTPIVANDNNYTIVTFRIGQGNTWTIAALNQWEEILPITSGGGVPAQWWFYDGTYHKHWNIKKIYVGESRRFGITSMRNIGMGIAELDVSFEISEG